MNFLSPHNLPRKLDKKIERQKKAREDGSFRVCEPCWGYGFRWSELPSGWCGFVDCTNCEGTGYERVR